MWSTLRQRDFALLWFGGLVSYIGNWAMLVALPLYVFDVTRSTFAAGAVVTALFAPLLLASAAGVFVDRWDRRTTVVRANLAMTVLTLPLLLVRGADTVGLVYACVVAVALAGLVVSPAENALLPRLVGRDRLMIANSLNSLNDNIARILGPAVGGLAMATVGFRGVVALNAVSFALAAALVSLIRTGHSTVEEQDAASHPVATSPQPSHPLRRLWLEWVAGLSQVRRSRVVTVVFVVTATALLGDAMFSALLAPWTAETFPVGSAVVLGLVNAARGVGGIVGGFVAAQASRRVRPGALLGWSAVVVGGVLAGMVLVPLKATVLAGAALLGVLAICWLASTNTILQTNIDDRYLGRVFATFSTTNAVMLTLGSLGAGALAETVGMSPLLLAAAALYSLAGVVALVAIRARHGSDAAPAT